MKKILLLIFLIHMAVFFGVYLRDRHLYQILFAGGFLGLVIYYLVNIVSSKAPGLVKIFRYLGVILLIAATPLFVSVRPGLGLTIVGIMLLILIIKFSGLKQKLMTSPRVMMFVMRLMLWYVKRKGERMSMDLSSNQDNSAKGGTSKLPGYITVILISVVFVFAWLGMTAGQKPKMAANGPLQVIYSYRGETDIPAPYRIALSAFSPKIGVPENGVRVYYITKEDYDRKKNSLQKSDFSETVLTKTTEANYFVTFLPPREKNQKYYFFVEAVDKGGNRLTLPDDPINRKEFLTVAFKIDPTLWILAIHIALMLAALFFIIHVFYYVFNYLWNKQEWNITKAFNGILWGMIAFGISGFPLGMFIAYQKWGVAWGGVPFGWDLTDNKTLIVFVYWLLVLVMAKKTLFKKGPAGYKTFAWLSILGILLTIVIFVVIPHSLSSF